MKRWQGLMLGAGLCVAVAGAAHAQMGMDFFKKSAIATIFHPIVGGGGIYETIDTSASGGKSSVEMSVVGKEMLGLKEAYWLEFTIPEKERTIYSKVLVSKDDFQLHKVIFQMPGAPAMEMPMNPSGRENKSMNDELKNWSQTGTETVTVPAGTFICQHWKKNDGKGEIWSNDKISPFGMVKEVEPGTTRVLVKILTDAKDHITGPVQPFNPQAMQQLMMQQRANPNQ